MYSLLLIDDETIVRVGMKNCIDWEKHHIHTVYEAENGREALDIIRRHTVDIVITDIKMAGMDGIEMLRELERESHRPEVIVMSCYNDYDTMRAVMQYGVRDFLFKPQMYPQDIELVLEKTLRQLEAAKARDADWAARELGELRTDNYLDCYSALMERLDNDPALLLNEAKNLTIDYIIRLSGLYEGGENALRLLSQTLFDSIYLLHQCHNTREIVRLLRRLSPNLERPSLHPGRDKVYHAICFIKEHLTDPNLSMEWVAEEVGLSPSYFSRLFKSVMGLSYISYITKRRIEEADRLYQTTDLKIYEIAERVGYTNTQYFSRLYKQQKGQNLSGGML